MVTAGAHTAQGRLELWFMHSQVVTILRKVVSDTQQKTSIYQPERAMSVQTIRGSGT